MLSVACCTLQLAAKLKLRRAWVDSGSMQLPQPFEQLEHRSQQSHSAADDELAAKLAKQIERNSRG